MTDDQGKKDFSILYKQYVKSLRYHLICKYNIPEDAVDDVLQEIFFKFFHKFESFRGDCSIATWLNKIATSVASDYWRKNAKEDHAVSYDEEYNDETEKDSQLFDILKFKSETEEDQHHLKICLEQTKAHLKREGNTELLNGLQALLWQQQGLSIQEISEKIGRNYDATKTYLSQCSKKLAQYPLLQECKGIFLKICLERIKANLEHDSSKNAEIIACLEAHISRLEGLSIVDIGTRRRAKYRETKSYLSSCKEKLMQHSIIPKECRKWLDYLK